MQGSDGFVENLLGGAMMTVACAVCGMEFRMSMAWVPGCRRQMCPNALRRSLQIVVARGGCPVRVSIEAFVT